MKKAIIFACLLTSIAAQAQEGYGYFNFGYGIMDANSVKKYHLAYEMNNGSYNSWEIVFEAQIDNTFDVMIPLEIKEEDKPQSFISEIRKEEIFMGGVLYEPLLSKRKNLLLNFRTGLLAGSGNGNFVAALTGGFEVSFTLPGQIVLILQQNNYYIINIEDRFRHSLEIGIKIPL